MSKQSKQDNENIDDLQNNEKQDSDANHTELEGELLEPEDKASDQVRDVADEQSSDQAAEVLSESLDIESLLKQLEETQQKAKENWETALRAQAETDNVRKRAVKDVESAHKYSLEKLVNEFLPVKDSLELGLDASDQADVASLKEGMELTIKMFANALEKCGVKLIDPTGEKFDPELHQAMTMIETPDAESGTVIDVMQKGYQLNERLIRPAMVVVAK